MMQVWADQLDEWRSAGAIATKGAAEKLQEAAE